MDTTMQQYLNHPDDFHALLKAAMAGDQAVLPEVRAILDVVPQWADELGNLLGQTERTLLKKLGQNLFEQEAITRDLDQHERRLTEELSYPEVLVIRLLRIDLLMLHAARKRAQERGDVQSDKLLNSAHRRFLATLKHLDQFRRLSPSIKIQVAQNQVNLS